MGAAVSRKTPVYAFVLLALSWVAGSAADLKDMIGKWRWRQFMIEVSACQLDSICAKVTAGPKNV